MNQDQNSQIIQSESHHESLVESQQSSDVRKTNKRKYAQLEEAQPTYVTWDEWVELKKSKMNGAMLQYFNTTKTEAEKIDYNKYIAHEGDWPGDFVAASERDNSMHVVGWYRKDGKIFFFDINRAINIFCMVCWYY